MSELAIVERIENLEATLPPQPVFGVDVEPRRDRALLPRANVLVAGIGNMFLGDDGFGVDVVMELRVHSIPSGVDVVDYGIRAADLAFALGRYDAAVLVDALPRGGAPGTLYVLEPHLEDEHPPREPHVIDPIKILRLARALGHLPARTILVGCEPERLPRDDRQMEMVLSSAVAAAIPRAVIAIEKLLPGLLLGAGRPRCDLGDVQEG